MTSPKRPMRASPARATTTPSRSPLLTLFNLVSRLPRRGRISKPRPNALSCAVRRGLEVPITEPAGNSPRTSPSRATSASRASSRGGIAAIVNRGILGGRQILVRVHGDIHPAVVDGLAQCRGEDTDADRGDRIAARSSPSVAMMTNSAWCPLATRASLMTLAWVFANRLPRVPIRMRSAKCYSGFSRSVVTKGISGPATASTACGSNSNSSRRASA